MIKGTPILIISVYDTGSLFEQRSVIILFPDGFIILSLHVCVMRDSNIISIYQKY